MNKIMRGKRLLPWYFGILVLAAVIRVGYKMSAGRCLAPTAIEFRSVPFSRRCLQTDSWRRRQPWSFI